MPLPPFKNPSFLNRALTHRSYVNEHPEFPEDNERLEFLGDAVLDFLVGAFLYHQYPEKSEGELTRLRSALVRTEQLAFLARELKINELLRLGKGEAEAGGRDRLPLLCAGFEAMIGAYFLDSGIEAVQQFAEPLFAAVAEKAIRDEADTDAKSLLQEWTQANWGKTPHYVVVQVTGPEHDRQFQVEVRVDAKVLGYGSGRNKQTAAQAAAQMALSQLRNP